MTIFTRKFRKISLVLIFVLKYVISMFFFCGNKERKRRCTQQSYMQKWREAMNSTKGLLIKQYYIWGKKKKEKSYHFAHPAQGSTNFPSISTKKKVWWHEEKRDPHRKQETKWKKQESFKRDQIKLNLKLFKHMTRATSFCLIKLYWNHKKTVFNKKKQLLLFY